MAETIRSFVAISLPSDVTTLLAKTGRRLAQQIPDRKVRWVAPEQMHLTLRFLGATPRGDLPALAARLNAVARRFRPFPLRLGALGCFPNERRPRVIWAGIVDETGQLPPLKTALDAVLEDLGWEAEDGVFQPHLTLGRVKDRPAPLPFRFGEALEPATWTVTAIEHIESQLRSGGPIYTIRHTSLLGQP